MTTQAFKYYKPRISIKNVYMFLVVFGISTIAGVFIFFMFDKFVGLAIFLASFLVLFVIGFKISAIDKKYAIGEQEVLIKTMYQKKIIDFNDIEYVSLLTQKVTTDLLNYYYKPVMEAGRSLNLFKWFRATKNYSIFQQFVSVPIVNTVTKAGGPYSITNFNTSISNDAVLLKTKTYGYILITPKETDAFVKELSLKGVMLSSEDIIANLKVTDEDIIKLRQIKPSKYMRYYMIISFLLIATIALTYSFVINKTPAKANKSAPKPSTKNVSLKFIFSLAIIKGFIC